MKWKLLLATFSMALVLGACSGNNAPATPGTPTPDAGSGGGSGNGDSGGNGDDGGSGGGAEPIELGAANRAYLAAEQAVMRAIAAAGTATPAAREAARKAIADARTALDEAVRLARAAVTAADDQDPAALGAATRALNRANSYKTAQNAALDTAQASLAWYGQSLVRYTIPNGAAGVPADGANVAKIERIDRAIPSPTDPNTQITNPKAFTSSTFKTVMYAEGKRVFSTNDDADGGDEFKVDGYHHLNYSATNGAPYTYLGLKVTREGLVIRTGGAKPSADALTTSDHTDMRRNLMFVTDDSNRNGIARANDGVPGQNGWDLAITFDAPQTMSVPTSYRLLPDPFSSWTGNGDFYWRALVEPADSQLAGGKYYESRAFRQPAGFENLGLYEVWLSNHLGADTNLEPEPGSGAITCPDGSIGTSCPYDDEQFYLKYAAYGMFVYTADVGMFDTQSYTIGSVMHTVSGQAGRVQSLHFGYSAFADETGKKTTDIGASITSGTFRGQTLAIAFRGSATGNKDYAQLRGDASLTVTIPKTGSGTVEGTLDGFEEWTGNRWKEYAPNFSVALSSASISDAGEFSGTTSATGRTDLNGEAGIFRGSFYGPRDDVADLEVAGSWGVLNVFPGATEYNANQWKLMGSFGAKQWPVPGS